MADSLHRFSIEKNCELSVVFDFHELQIMGMGVVDNRVVIFCSDYEGSPISVYDTTAKEFIGELPNSDVHTEGGGDQEIEMRVVVRNNLALLTDCKCHLKITKKGNNDHDICTSKKLVHYE